MKCFVCNFKSIEKTSSTVAVDKLFLKIYQQQNTNRPVNCVNLKCNLSSSTVLQLFIRENFSAEMLYMFTLMARKYTPHNCNIQH